MNKIAILTNHASDLSELILKCCPTSEVFPLSGSVSLDGFDAVAVLGGCEDDPVCIPAALRIKIEKMKASGKAIFCEYTASIGYMYNGNIDKVKSHRLVYGGFGAAIHGLESGDLLDGHDNDIMSMYQLDKSSVTPLLVYHEYVNAHDRKEMDEETFNSGKYALWLDGSNTLIAAFRIGNFNKARFAPLERWHKVIRFIVNHLAGENVEPEFPEPVCRFEKRLLKKTDDVYETVKRGLDWFTSANMLVDNGCGGVREGLRHQISAKDGVQARAEGIRTDCSGEIGGAYMLDWLVRGNDESRKRFEALEDFCFDLMQIKDGIFEGMIRWTETAWYVCYQDDVARAILPTLIKQKFIKEGSRHFEDAVSALNFLVKTTGTNGLRVSRTDCIKMNEAEFKRLRETESGTSRVHHNGYYHAALLLCAQCGGPKEFAEIAERGLTAIMEIYPDNEREHSETEELCRLVFPLAVLYETTGNPEHLKWLERVTDDLDRFGHQSGSYAEWDTGYRANRSRKQGSECSLLADNGDPVSDLLYSVNWLPLGFAYAYHAVHSQKYYDKWLGISSFMASCQILSDSENLNGAWARAFDLDRFEIYGVPHDIGWSPCCIESGWTVAEILFGLQFMEFIEKQKP